MTEFYPKFKRRGSSKTSERNNRLMEAIWTTKSKRHPKDGPELQSMKRNGSCKTCKTIDSLKEISVGTEQFTGPIILNLWRQTRKEMYLDLLLTNN
jgi:hypothetical protein